MKRVLVSALLLAVMSAGAVTAQTTPGSDAHTPPATQNSSPEKKPDPFAFADFTWLSGNPRTKESPLDTKVFTGEFRVDTNFTYSFNRPTDDTIVGSSEIFRSGEFQLTQLGIGGDFHYQGVHGRLMTHTGPSRSSSTITGGPTPSATQTASGSTPTTASSGSTTTNPTRC